MNRYLSIALLGPLLGIAGLAATIPWLYWIGAALCALQLLFKLMSAERRILILPAILAALGAFVFAPWYTGAALGLVVWAAYDTISGMVKRDDA